MPLSIKFPLYGSTLVTGPYNVSLSFPGPTSIISKSIGLKEPSILLVPNISYITKFIEGNLGIADNMVKQALLKNLSNPISTKSEGVFSRFAENTNSGVGDINKLKDDKGRLKIRESDINLELDNDVGFKMFETIALKSVFETQKPYLALAEIVIDAIVDIEEIIARLGPLLSVSPLTTKSKKPAVNGGSGNKPKAIGFKGSDSMKKVKQLKNLTTGGATSDEEGNVKKGDNTDSNTTESNIGNLNKDRYEIISTVYSTGKFDPNVNYKYIYIDLPPEINVKPQLEEEPEGVDELDKYKPETLILGIYKQDGSPLNPNEKLKVKVIRNGLEEEVNTPFKKASWITQSDKWKLGENSSEWPSFNDPYYVWKKGISQKTSNKKPEGFSLKKYKKGDKNILTKEDAIEGNPVISKFDKSDTTEYFKYYADVLGFELSKSGLPKEEQISIKSKILKSLDIKQQLENSILYGQLSKNSVYKESFPSEMRKLFKPIKIFSAGAAADKNLKKYALSVGQKPGMIWIDPETDYKLKVIKVKPSTSIRIDSDTKEGVSEIKTVSLSNNNTLFKFKDNENFNIKLVRNLSNDVIIENNITEFSLSNWNYGENNKENNRETYDLEIWRENPFEFYRKNKTHKWNLSNGKKAEIVKEGKYYFYKEFKLVNGVRKEIPASGIIKLEKNKKIFVENKKITKWIYYENKLDFGNLPKLNQQKTFTIDFKTLNVDESIKNSASYSTQITTNDNTPGKIVNPADLTKEILVNGRFSKGKYGHGSKEEPQSVDSIKRFMLTESDTETYYIIEGILESANNNEDGPGSTDENSNKDKSGSGGYYRIPHALGVFKVFIKLLIKIFAKLVPQAAKLISLFKNPFSFIVDILIAKLGEHFGPLSSDSVNKLKTSLEVSPDRYNSTKDYVKARQKPITESRLKNYVYINEYNGELRTLLDGTTLIPFKIFGKDLPFGMDLKMDRILKKPPVKLIFPKLGIKSLNPNLQSNKLKVPFKDETNRNDVLSSLKGGSLPTKDALNNLDNSYPFNTQFNVREETTSIQYSTGEYLPGVDYNYIYINEDVKLLLDQVDELIKKGDDESLLKANQLMNQAIDLDPKNSYLKGKKKELKDLLNKTGINTQPLFKLLLGVVTLPIKIVAGIVEYILKFFKSLLNPFTLPAKIAEFLSFKWMLTFFTPKGILDMMGIKFDPLLIKVILEKAFAKKANGDWLISDDTEIDNLTDIINIAVIKPLPVYTYGMVRMSPNILSLSLRPILKLLESIINGIIKFLWSILGIEAIIKVPKVKLSSDDGSLSAEELSKLINNDSVDDLLNPTDESEDDGSADGTGSKLNQFVYEIKLPNGDIVKKTSLEELNKYMENNSEFNYEKNF